MEFRTLRANEIELRVGTCSEKGFSLLLYKDARCDMNLLDEVLGTTGWQRTHEVVDGRLCCTISIWDDNKNQWIKKQDVGTESFTEKDKGQFSDSFKRSAVNVGIGRELYTAPFIWIKGHVKRNDKGKYVPEDNYDRDLHISEIEYDKSRSICRLVIKDKNNIVAYSYPKSSADKSIDKNKKTASAKPQTPAVDERDRPMLVSRVSELMEEKNLNAQDVYKKVGVNNIAEIETSRLTGMIAWLEEMKG